MLCGNVVKLEKFFLRASPHLVKLRLRTIFGLVPNLPVLYTIVKAVCPAFVIMTDYMLADSCPLSIVLWRTNVIGLNKALIFDGDSKAVIGLYAIIVKGADKGIGKGKIVGGGIVFVGIKVAENIWNIDEFSAAEGSPYVL